MLSIVYCVCGIALIQFDFYLAIKVLMIKNKKKTKKLFFHLRTKYLKWTVQYTNTGMY